MIRISVPKCMKHHRKQQQRALVNFTLIGPPGSGKGTYGKLFIKNIVNETIIDNAKQHKPFFLSMGDVLREHVHENTSVGKKVAEYQNLGKLADDEIVSAALLDTLHPKVPKIKESKNGGLDLGFLLDGYPRTVQQAQLISPSVPISVSLSWPPHLQVQYAISIEVPFFVCRAKILGRRSCRKCGESFNVNGVDQDGFFMPAFAPKCSCFESTKLEDIEDSNWSVRSDDTEDIVEARYNEFKVETEPVLTYYESMGKLIRFIPYRGIEDMDKLEQLIKEKMNEKSY